MKRRILHIVDSLERSGTARQVSHIARGLQDAFDVHVCALSRGGPIAASLARHGIPVTVIGRRWAADPLAFRRLLRHLKDVWPAVVCGWQAAGRAYAALAGRLAGVERLVAVWRGPGPRLWFPQEPIERFVGGQADVAVADCEATREHCLRQGIPAEKLEVVPGGVPCLESPALTREQVLARLGLPEKVRLIAWAGRLEPDRCGKDAIWAADLLKVIRDDAHLLMFGDGPHRQRLLRFCRQVEIVDKVHFLGDREDFFDILPACDQFWSTGRRFGRPLAVLEAMAAGVPVIAAAVPGTVDLIAHEATGYLVAPGHRAGWARWAEHLLNHPDVARQVGLAGQERARSEFSLEKMLERWRAICMFRGISA